MNLGQKPSGIYFVEFEDKDGERRRVSCGTREKKLAEQKARDIIINPPSSHNRTNAKGQRIVKPKGFTLSDAFDLMQETEWSEVELKSQATMRSNVKILTQEIGADVLVTDITYSMLQMLTIKWRKMDKLKPATIRKRIHVMSRVLKQCTKWSDPDTGLHYLTGCPAMPKVTVRNLKERVVSQQEERDILLAIDARHALERGSDWYIMRRLVVFLLDSGGRLGETQNLPFREVYSDYIQYTGDTTKNGLSREVPLSLRAKKGVMEIKELFGGNTPFGSLTPAKIWRLFNKIKDDVGDLDGITMHTFRHTCATRLLKGDGINSMDLARVSDWLGHQDISVTKKRYGHLNKDDLMSGLSILKSVSS